MITIDRRVKNLAGQKFNMLTAIECVDNNSGNGAVWRCICSCGQEKFVSSRDLKRNAVKSCGCYKHPKPIKDEIGHVYGRLTVLESAGTHPIKHQAQWLCRCSCGNLTIATGVALRTSHRPKRSCGCAVKENPKGDKAPNWKGGVTSLNRIVRSSRTYKEWRVDVLERDNHICQLCETRVEDLEAHHILNFSSNEDLRTELSNGISLCTECHAKFHLRFTNYNNTYNQLVNFKNGWLQPMLETIL